VQWTLWCDRCPIFKVLEFAYIPRSFCIVITTAFYESTPSQPSLLKTFISYFSCTYCVATISLLSLAYTIALDCMEGWNQEFQHGEDEES
jgi:hypothetical protein